MEYCKREKLQKELLSGPEPRISLPGTLEQTTVVALAVLVAQVTHHSYCT